MSLSSSKSNNKTYPWSQKKLNSFNPFPRYYLSSSHHAINDKLFLFGGISQTKATNEVFIIETNTFNVLPTISSGNVPHARSLHTQINVGANLFVFGGKPQKPNDKLDDGIYVLDTDVKDMKYVWAKPQITGNPGGRYGHTSVLVGSMIYTFGGQDYNKYLNDLISFDTKNVKLQKKKNKFMKFPLKGNSNQLPAWNFIDPKNSPPPARSGHVSCVYQNKIYIFGGSDGKRYYNDTWCYDIQENTWTELSCIGYIPTPRELHGATIVNDVMYIFGGRVKEDVIKELGDLCAFRISNLRWYKFPNLGLSPCPRYGLSMTLSRDKVFIFGGVSSQTKPDDDGTIHILDTSKIKYPTGSQLTRVVFPEENSTQSKKSALVSSLDTSNINISIETQTITATAAITSFQQTLGDNLIHSSLSPPPRPSAAQSSDSSKSKEVRQARTVLDQIPEENSSELERVMSFLPPPQSQPPSQPPSQPLPPPPSQQQQQQQQPPPPPQSRTRKLSKGKEVDRNPISMISQPSLSQPKVITNGIIMSQGPVPSPSGFKGKMRESVNVFQPQNYSSSDSDDELQTISPNGKSMAQIPSFNNNNNTSSSLLLSTTKSRVNSQEINVRTRSLQDRVPFRREHFEIQGTIPEDSTEITSQDEIYGQQTKQRAHHRRTASQELQISKVLPSRRISIDSASRPTIQELNYSPRTYPIRRASADNYKTTFSDNQRVNEFSTERTIFNNQRTSSMMSHKPNLVITEKSPKRALSNSKKSNSLITESTTFNDDQKPLTSLPSKVNDQKTISMITEFPSSIDNQIISPNSLSSTDDQKTSSPMTEQSTTSPIEESSISTDQIITPTDQKFSPTEDQIMTSVITESQTPDMINTITSTIIESSPSTNEDQNINNNNISISTKSISTNPINNDQISKELFTNENNNNDDATMTTRNEEEKIKNIQNTSKNNYSPVSSVASVNSIKRDSFDSLASSDSNQSSSSLCRRSGKEVRPRGARPMSTKPNNGSPLYIRTDSDEIDRNNLLKLRQKLALTKFSDSSEDLSISSSSPSEIVVYNEGITTLQQSRSQSSNSSVSDFKLNNNENNESEGSIYDDDNEEIVNTPPQPNSNVDDENLIRELEKHKSSIEVLKQRESWFRAELDSARKSGFTPDLYDNTNNDDGDNTIRDIEQMLTNDDDDINNKNADRNKVIETIVQMQQKLLEAKTTISNQAQIVSEKVASSERARSKAIQEATYFKAKLETLVKYSDPKFSTVESNKTKELEDQLIKIMSENQALENKLSDLENKKSLNDQTNIDLSRAEAAEKACEGVLAKLAALRMRATTAESELENSNKQIEKINDELENLKKEKSNDKLQIRNLQTSLSHHQQVYEQVSVAVITANERAESAEQLWKKSRNEVLKLEKEVTGLRNELEHKTKEFDHAIVRIDEIEKLLDKVQKEGHIVRNMMQEGMSELLNISWWDKVSNNVWENAKIRKLEEDLAQLKSMRDESVVL